MRPDNAILRGGVPEGSRARVLAEAGKSYAIYLTPPLPDTAPAAERKAELQLEIPPGQYEIAWLDPRDEKETVETVEHGAGTLNLSSPAFVEDLAVAIRRTR